MSVSLSQFDIPVNHHMGLQREISSFIPHEATILPQGVQRESDIHNAGFICVKILGSTNFISLTDIVMLQAESNYTSIFLVNGKRLLTAKTLKTWHGIIGDDNGFLRPHRSFLVNRKHIMSYQYKPRTLNLTGAVEVPIARRFDIKQIPASRSSKFVTSMSSTARSSNAYCVIEICNLSIMKPS